MTAQTLAALIEELRIASLRRAAEEGWPADITLEWDVADSLAAIRQMLEDAVAGGGPVGVFAQQIVAALLAGSLEAYSGSTGSATQRQL